MIACGILGGVANSDELYRKKELKKAFKHLRRAGIDELKVSLTEEQLRQIDKARSRGDKISITLNFS